MKTHNLKLHVLVALMASASMVHVGCGDDDDQATPSNTGGKSSGTGGKSTGTGGTDAETGGTSTGTGGKSTGTGGKTTGTGGIDGGSGAGNSAGSGGEPMGGAGGTGTGGTGNEGGSGGSGGSDPGAEACDDDHFDAVNECYRDCEPDTTATSVEFLNRCSEAGANCTAFDNATLSKLVNGVLPPLP